MESPTRADRLIRNAHDSRILCAAFAFRELFPRAVPLGERTMQGKMPSPVLTTPSLRSIEMKIRTQRDTSGVDFLCVLSPRVIHGG